MNGLHAVIEVWLNASKRSRFGVRIKMSAGGRSVKRFERSNGLDIALFKNVPLFIYL